MAKRFPTKEEIIKTLKRHFNTEDVISADEIYDGENAYVVNDTKFITVFGRTAEAYDFYEKVILKNDNTVSTIDLIDRTLGKDVWKNYINSDELSRFMLSAVNGKNIPANIKYEIERRPIQALEFFFDKSKFGEETKINKILLKFCDKKLIKDSVESMFMKLKGHTLYVPETDSFIKAYDWSEVQ